MPKSGAERVREHYKRKAKEMDSDRLKGLLEKLFANAEVSQGRGTIEIDWGFTPSQWQVVHMIAELHGKTADGMLEELGRNYLNSRGSLQVGKGVGVVDTDDIELGG